MEVGKSRRVLSIVLMTVLVFTMLFANCGVVSAEEKAEITGTFGEYYTYTLNQNTGVVTFDMKDEKNSPVLGWHETVFRYLNQDIKEIHLTENVKKSEGYSLEWYLYRLWSAEKIVVNEHNPDFASQDGVLFSKDKTILYAYPAMKDDAQYRIPDSVAQIGIEEIDKQGTGRPYCPFESAENLKTVEIPATVTKIFCNSFSNQDQGGGNSIEKFVVDTGNTNYQSVDGVLFSKLGRI